MKKKSHRDLQRIYLEMKSKPCMDCGLSFDPICMDFDHRPNTEKIGAVSQLLREGSEKLLLEEVAKCDLVCACCHRLRTKYRGKPQKSREANRAAYEKNPKLREISRENARKGMQEYWNWYKAEMLDNPIEKEKRSQRAFKAWETRRAKAGTS